MNRIDRNFCILDGSRCIGCHKCEHMDSNVKSKGIVNKIFISIIIALILILIIFTLAFIGYIFADNVLSENDSPQTYQEAESLDDYYDNSLPYGQESKDPVPYYDTGFYVYTYQNNPATCGGGQCTKSDFAYY